MCDTIGIIKKNRALFGKNSDRSPNEPQVIEFIKGHKTNKNKAKLTYIEIDEVEYVYSILISRPTWMWGAEMGVNEFGVCIGNEAIFTKKINKKNSLIGMDFVRLGLERSKTAREAVEVITMLVSKYGQGGNCGYDHNFFYNNSFLIMDSKELYVVETEMNTYRIIKNDKMTISNCLSRVNNTDATIKENKLVTYFSKAKERQKQNSTRLDEINSVKDLAKTLRTHSIRKNDAFCKGTVSSTCMHAGGIIGDHTTSSLIVELVDNSINVWFTGTSSPCISVFKYYKFGEKIEYPICNSKYWNERENIFRDLIGYIIPNDYYELRDRIEDEFYNKKDKITLKEMIKKEDDLFDRLKNTKLKKQYVSIRYKKYWKKKNNRLKEIEEENDKYNN